MSASPAPEQFFQWLLQQCARNHIFPCVDLLFPFPSLMLYTEKAGFTDLPHSVFMGRCQSTQNHATATVAIIFDNTLKSHHVFWHTFTASTYNDCFTQQCSTRNSTTDTGILVFYAPHFRISVRTSE
jgi:hypothetical protein